MRRNTLICLLFLGLLLPIAAMKTEEEEDVEGSANNDNPDDEDSDVESSGIPPEEDEDTEAIVTAKNVHQKPTMPPSLYTTSRTVIKSGAAEGWRPGMTTIALLAAVLVFVILIIILVVICVRKRSNGRYSHEYTRGSAREKAYV